ncbi:MAG: hypothetical protein QXU97_01835 [Fervidicoccaceae archaeon]
MVASVDEVVDRLSRERGSRIELSVVRLDLGEDGTLSVGVEVLARGDEVTPREAIDREALIAIREIREAISNELGKLAREPERVVEATREASTGESS